ncbi:ATP-binding cassette subfamily C protein [Desulfitobacterium sp. LBE]|uniref:ABC transporter ATP-binding protein n=1 Tax=Desulfitobacterium sp. LBE TaxID=884086 RepID=UPI00119BEB6D|nr:ABC transporter ATP-binding protein [Desulfitobacterium sp. LBE]TWH57133.1 ATP-binding cassette subfamily C protein [Desulfitobacterium sp. LBE]
MTKTPTPTLTLVRRLFRIAASEKRDLTVSTLASILGNLGHVGLMGSGALLISASAGLLTSPPALWAILMLICSLGIGICRYLEGIYSHTAAYRLLADMRGDLFTALRRLAPARLMDRQKGDILSVAISDIETIEFFFAHTIGPLFTMILLPLLTLLLALSIHSSFALALLPVYIMICVVLPLLAIRLGRSIGQNYRERLGRLNSFMVESITAFKDIQIFRFGEKRAQLGAEETRGINRAAHALTIHRQLVVSAPAFFIYLARILVLAIASLLAARGVTHPEDIILLSFVVSASFSSTQSLTTVISNLLETFAAAQRFFAILDDEPEVREAEDALELESIERIEFADVSFAYHKEQNPVLQHWNLTIEKGDKIGIAGASGIGKSTLTRLLLRFWEPTEGEIRINGIPLQRLSLQRLRSRIAMLEQETFIFDDTITANIALGKPGATREEVVLSAKRARIHQFIETLPEGYDTRMGDLGGRLSGGERQRIGIARAMLSNPDMLVMDEPTSSLDILNEKSLLQTLREEYAETTLLIVSHRSSTLADCNRILHMENQNNTLIRKEST